MDRQKRATLMTEKGWGGGRITKEIRDFRLSYSECLPGVCVFACARTIDAPGTK